jgi:SAM-dependent methyltransferase
MSSEFKILNNIVSIGPDNKSLQEFYKLSIEKGLYSSHSNLKNHLSFMFGNKPLKKKRILDIGGGKGLLTFFAAANGGIATCLEPEFDGSHLNMVRAFNDFKTSFQSCEGTATLRKELFQNFNTEERYDLIIAANSINHLDEIAVTNIHSNPEKRSIYLKYFEKMYDLLRPAGQLIITDCDRHNFFNAIGLTNPLMPTIEWHKHQSPKIWTQLILEAGFTNSILKWSTPNSLGNIAKPFLANRLIAYMGLSHFRIEANKPQ